MRLFLSFLICILATTAGAVSGIGGGVIIKPVMDAISGLSVPTVSFLSSCTVLSMSIVSVVQSNSGKAKIEVKRGTLLALGGAAGGIIGKWGFDFVKICFRNDNLIGTVQSALMIVLTLGVFAYTLAKSHICTLNISNSFICTLIGLLLGMVSSFLGIGGGPINLAVLHFFFSMDTKTSALHSLYIIMLSQIAALISSILQAQVPEFEPAILVLMCIGGILGGFIGRTVSKKLTAIQIDVLFHGMMILILAVSCYNLWYFGTGN